ncbi:MAG: hypothetical protein QXN62_05140 [Candidatus Bathyarchaeia archaeon]|nr:hypothetical protein [Candidatus Bathyarchaeota archaeon]
MNAVNVENVVGLMEFLPIDQDSLKSLEAERSLAAASIAEECLEMVAIEIAIWRLT